MEQDWEYIAGRNQASRQYHKQKRKEAEEKLATLRAENERLREAFTNPDHEILAKVCYGVNCYPDELSDMLETYWDALK